MTQYYLGDKGVISTKKKDDKKGKSQLEYNRQVSEKMKQQRAFKEQVSRPMDYKSMDTSTIQQRRDALQKQILRYEGTTNSKGKYTLKGIFNAISGQTKKRLSKDKTYKSAQDRLSEMNSILEQRFNESPQGKSLPMQLVNNVQQNIVRPINTTTEELSENPIQTLKTTAVGFGEGFKNSKKAIQNSLLDLGKALSGDNQLYDNWYMRQKIDQNMQNINDPLKKTKTYKKLEEGTLGEGQQVAYNLATNIGAMGPAIATTAITGSPTAGSAVFYAQAQDNYYNEALKRGYNEKEARMYGLAMAGVETIVERLGFDEIAGLPEGSISKAMLGEGAEEFVTPYIDATFRKLGFKEDVKLKDVNKEAIEGALMGAATGGLMQLAGNGFARVDSLVDKINNGETVLPTDIQSAVEEVQQVDPNFMDNMLSEAVDNIDNDTLNEIKQEMNIQQPSQSNNNGKLTNLSDEEFEGVKKAADLLDLADEEVINEEQQRRNKLKEENEKFNKEAAKTIMSPINEKIKESKEAASLLNLDNKKTTKNKKETNYNFDEQIKTEGKKLNMSDKQIVTTQNEVKTFQNNIVDKNSSLEKVYETGNLEITKDGKVKKLSNEKDIQQLMNLTMPTDKKVAVKAKDLYGNDYTIKKPSPTFLEGVSTNKELFDKFEQNKTQKQKIQDKKDSIRYEQTFENFKNAIDSKDTERLESWEKVQNEHIVKTFSLDELRKEAGKEVLEDIDKVIEEVDTSIINKTADKHNMAQAAALASYYSGKGDWKNADKYRRKASSMSSMFGGNLVSTKLIYQDNPEGALNAYLAAIDETFKEDSKYHEKDVEWHKKNDMINEDGTINENSPYNLKDEVKDELRAKIQEWYKIENAMSKEAQIKQKEIETLIQQNLPDKPFAQKVVNFRKTAMMNNVGIWVRNSRQEFIDVTNAVATDVGATVADKKIEKLRNEVENRVREEQGLEKQNKRHRTTSITTIKAGKFMSGYKNGAKNHWESLKNDINMNHFGTRYDADTKKSSKSRVSSIDDTISRKSTNKFVMFLEKMNAVGMSSDTRFAEGYYAQALYDAQAQLASNKAANDGVKAVVRTEVDASGARITYIDPETLGIQNDIVATIKNNEELKNYIEAQDYKLFEQSEVDSILDQVEQEANYRTLQDKGALSEVSLKMVDLLNKYSVKYMHYPLGSHLIPFIKARTEQIRLAYNSTPLAMKHINKEIKNFENLVELNAKGIKTDVDLDMMQRKISKELGQVYGGTFLTTAFLATAGVLYGMGKMVGKNPDEKEGEKEYSIKVGDKNYSFNIDSITAFQLKTASILMDKKNISDSDDFITKFEKSISNFASPVTDAIIEQTIISSFGEYFDKGYGDRWDTLAYQFSRLPQSFIPSFSKNIAITLDGFKNRDTSSDTYLGKMINGIGSKLPVIRSLYAEKKNEWGSVEDASLNIFEKAWNTMISQDISASKTTKVDKELYDLYIETKSPGLFPSTGLKNHFSRGNNTYNLSEKELKKYQNTYATTAFNMLDKLIDNQQYKKANKKDKTLMVKAVYNHAQEIGQNEYLKNKNISITTEKSAIERVIEQNISYDSAKYQKDNPIRWKLFTSIVSDFDDYKTIENRINEIQDTYSYDNGFSTKTQLNMVIDYVNGLNNLSATQKAMLIRMSSKSATYKKSYSSYDNKIDDYLKTLHLSNEEYDYFIKGNNLALEGYYGTYYTTKKNK